MSGLVLIVGLILGITTLIGILGNFAVCLAVFWNRSMRTPINLLLMNLAVADMGMSASCMPFAVATVFFREQQIGEAFCDFNGFVNTLFAMASVLTICTICIFHYVSVVMPLDKALLTGGRCVAMVICAWVIAVFLAAGPTVRWGRYEFTSNIFNCEYSRTSRSAEISYGVMLMICGFIFPFFVMIFAYVRIFKALREHTSRMSRTSIISSAPAQDGAVSMETKLYVTALLILLTFLICRTPFFAVLVLSVKYKDDPPDSLAQLSFWAIYLHSACDPFIFAFKHTEYQETLKDVGKTFLLLLKGCCVQQNTLRQNDSSTPER